MCIQLFMYIYIYIDLALAWVRPVTNFYYTHLAGASVMDDTKMAWHDIAGRLASNEEGARSKALHFWLPPKTFLFTHLVFDFSGLPPCSQSTLKRVWVKHGNKKPWHRRVTWTSSSCVFHNFLCPTHPGDCSWRYDELWGFEAVQWTNGWVPLAYIALDGLKSKIMI